MFSKWFLCVRGQLSIDKWDVHTFCGPLTAASNQRDHRDHAADNAQAVRSLTVGEEVTFQVVAARGESA